MGSRSSVVPFFIKRARAGVIPITDENMTRFNITLNEGVEMVKWALKNAIGGEVFVPKIPSYRVIDQAEAIGPSCKKEIVGIRPGEKLHEEMITSSDSFTTIDLGRYFAIYQAMALFKSVIKRPDSLSILLNLALPTIQVQIVSF